MKFARRSLLPLSLLIVAVVFSGIAAEAAKKPLEKTAEKSTDKTDPIRVLLIAGGCCHDYAKQSAVLKAGVEERIHAEVTVIYSENRSTETTFEHYNDPNWADGYDVILHDECSANVTDKPYIDRILAAHKNGVPAVNIHCAMHCYRWDFRAPVEKGADNAGWYEFLGIQSTGHGPKAPIDVTYVAKAAHPIAKGLDNWTTTTDELYNNVQVFENMKPIAMGRQIQPPSKKALKADPNAKGKEETAVLAWTNVYGPKKTKVFCVTLGHTDEVVENPNYIDLISRGLLWTTGHMAEDGTAEKGYAY